MPVEGTQLGKTQGTLHVLAMEGVYFDPTGGPGATPTIKLFWHAHASGVTVEAQEAIQMQEGDVDLPKYERCGEVWVNVVHIVWEEWVITGGGSSNV